MKKIEIENCLQTRFPKIAAEWHPIKNGDLKPENFSYGSSKKVWWKCPVANDHEWLSSINSRITSWKKKAIGCPCCNGKKIVLSNCLATTHPELANQWHPTKNGDLSPNQTTAGSDKIIWWKCPVAIDHEWQAKIQIRKKGNGCICCRGFKVVNSNCLATTYPKIATQWHPTKNGNLTPHNIVPGSRKKIWWKCDKNHEWKAVVGSRTCHNQSCPYCKTSIGENTIAEILRAKDIPFERECKFKTCKDENCLPFDFMIKLGSKLKLIEYQGQQHYRPLNFGSTVKDARTMFAYVQKHDAIKRHWCQKNKIQLLEIPYWELKNIELLVKQFCETQL